MERNWSMVVERCVAVVHRRGGVLISVLDTHIVTNQITVAVEK
jgi:hypothetical protein